MPDFRENITQEFRETKQRIDALKAEARSRAKITFEAGTEKLFEAHPLLQNFAWSQYTPYFNDGDECIFGANDIYINVCTGETYEKDPETLTIARSLSDAGGYGWFEEYAHPYFNGYGEHNRTQKEIGWREDRRLNPNYDPNYLEAEEAVVAFRGIFDDNDLKDLFGDHKVVFVSRENGVETEEYEHE